MALSGPLPGSELAWQGVYTPSAGSDHTSSHMISADTLKYLVYQKNPPADYMLADLMFSRDSFLSATQLHALYDVTDPDLSSCAKGGGKLILWHGLADPHISPLNTIAYYTAINGAMGEVEVQKFARLYLFPGGYHCSSGEGPFDFDLMSAIMAWVERGTAPFAIAATHKWGGAGGLIAGVQAGMPAGGRPGMMPPAGTAPPQDSGHDGPPPMLANETKADRTRPVYPYPQTAVYSGSGSIDDAKNFNPGPARPASPLALQWLGASFYTPHYELWRVGEGAAMTCNVKP